MKHVVIRCKVERLMGWEPITLPQLAIITLAVIGSATGAMSAAEATETEPHKCAASRARAVGLSGYLPVTGPKPVPLTSFMGANDTTASTKDWRGRGLVLNFWATWCPPCVKELPALNELKAKFSKSGIDVVAVNEDLETIAQTAAFLKTVGATGLTPYIDRQRTFLKAARIASLPTTLIIDQNGNEVAAVLTDANWNDPAIADFIKGCIAPQ